MFRAIVALSVLCLVAVNGLDNEDRIVNGRTASIHELPYQVSLQQNGGHFCGGSILSPYWILTAAHCLIKRLLILHLLTVRYGTSKWNSGGSVKQVESAMLHPNYNHGTMEFDCAVVKLTGKITYSAVAKPVTLCNRLPAEDALLIVSGWGQLSENNPNIPTDLQAVNVKLVSKQRCASRPFNYGNAIMKTMFCATASAKDSCQGDSGGPINMDGTHKQCGIVSWGVGCAQPGSPGVYCDLSDSTIRSFITKHTNV